MRKLMIAALATGMFMTPAVAQQVEDEEIVEKEMVETTDADGEKHVEKRVVIKKGDGVDYSIDGKKAERMMSDCAGRMFEASAMVKTPEGKLKKTNIKLCGTSDNDADWVKLLKDAKERISTAEQLQDESRDDIIADLDAEIAKYEQGEDAEPAS